MCVFTIYAEAPRALHLTKSAYIRHIAPNVSSADILEVRISLCACAVCLSVCLYVCMYCVCVCVCVCVCACMHVCVYMCCVSAGPYVCVRVCSPCLLCTCPHVCGVTLLL